MRGEGGRREGGERGQGWRGAVGHDVLSLARLVSTYIWWGSGVVGDGAEGEVGEG